MGRYYTCQLCDVESKSFLDCDCYEDEKQANLTRIKEGHIESTFYVKDSWWISLIIVLKTKSDEIIYMDCIVKIIGEVGPYRQLVEISNSKYEDYKSMLDDRENHHGKYTKKEKNKPVVRECKGYDDRCMIENISGSMHKLYFSRLPKELLVELEKYIRIEFIFVSLNSDWLLLF